MERYWKPIKTFLNHTRHISLFIILKKTCISSSSTGLARSYVAMAMTAAITLAAAFCSFWSVSAQQHCDIYKGSWVRDDSYPLYDSSSCPFSRREFDCKRYGRPDDDYLKFRWQPADCDLQKSAIAISKSLSFSAWIKEIIPDRWWCRFDGENLLRRWAGKKVMLVGDSLTLNQYISLLCMVHAAVPNATYDFTRDSSGIYTATFQVLISMSNWMELIKLLFFKNKIK